MVYVTKSTEPAFIKIILIELKGTARESVRDEEFGNLQELFFHLKKLFAPTKKYQWCFEAIVNLRMKQTERVSDYYLTKAHVFKLFSGPPSGRHDESHAERLSQNETVSGGPKWVFRTRLHKEDSPVVQLNAPEFREGKALCLVDPGSDVNLIKLQAWRGDLIVSDGLIKIMGIAEESVNTMATVIVKLLDDSVGFHVVLNDFPISVERIIGRAYLHQEQTQLSFRHNSLVIISRPVTPIPFIESESQAG